MPPAQQQTFQLLFVLLHQSWNGFILPPSDMTQAKLRKVLLTSVHREVPLSHCETACEETGTTRSGFSTKAGSTILNKDNANTGRDLQA